MIQRHEVAPGNVHFDLMLEHEGVLRTWRLLEPEAATEGKRVSLQPIQDHRIVYLDYEGEVSGGRGDVRRWDAGTYESRVWERDHLEVVFVGTRIRGLRSLRVLPPPAAWMMEAPKEIGPPPVF